MGVYNFQIMYLNLYSEINTHYEFFLQIFYIGIANELRSIT